MCTLIGAIESTDSATVASPNAVWLKTVFEFRGHKLHAHGFLSTAGKSEVFTVVVDLRPIAAVMAKAHARLHGKVSGCIGCSESELVSGCPECIEVGRKKKRVRLGKAVKSIGKAKAIRAIAKTGKAIIKSKVVGIAAAAAAAIFPPVGAPALAAYAAANAALNQVEKSRGLQGALKRGGQQVKPAQKLANFAKKTARSAQTKLVAKAKRKGLFKKFGPAKVMQSIKKAAKGVAQKKVRKVLSKAPAIKRAVVRAVSLKKTLKSPKVLRGLSQVKKTGDGATSSIRAIVDRAKTGDVKARRAASVLATVAEHRHRMAKRAPGVDQTGSTGLLIDCNGKVTKGRFRRGSGTGPMSTLMTSRGAMPGYYQQVGACVGCSPAVGYPIGNYMLIPGQ